MRSKISKIYWWTASAAFNWYLRNFIVSLEPLFVLIEYVPLGEICWVAWERAVDWMILTSKTRISNHRQIWPHNSWLSCLANRWWNVLFVIDTGEWWNYSLNDVPIEQGFICHSLYFAFHWTVDKLPRTSSHASWVTLKSLVSLKGVFQKKLFLFV